MKKWIAVLAMGMGAGAAFAAELTLFDIPLRTSSREEIRSAIAGAGGRLTKSSTSTDVYDATKIGLPGAQQLEVVYLDDRLVMAQYKLQLNMQLEERVRKMLVSKYGQPGGGDFAGTYVGHGKYKWGFDGAMELVFKKDFFSSSPIYLSYVNKSEEARLGKLLEDADRKAAEREAASKKSVF